MIDIRRSLRAFTGGGAYGSYHLWNHVEEGSMCDLFHATHGVKNG